MNLRVETGACFCGNITAQIIGEPFWICYDHDDDCRRAVGIPLNLWVGCRPSQFTLLRGTLKRFSKTKGITRSFCGDCGTSIAMRMKDCKTSFISPSASWTTQNDLLRKLMPIGV
jgi:hypothetical protein